MTQTNWSEADFERLSWHDNHIYGLHLQVGDIERGDWRSELVLDIDHIVAWVKGGVRGVQFRVAPATLTFHHVTDLRLDLDWGDSGFQVNINEASIEGITRAQVPDQKICLDRPYYRWVIATNLPRGGKIVFGASGFTQSLRAEPVLQDEQKLSSVGRAG
jgi:hypothetical protein